MHSPNKIAEIVANIKANWTTHLSIENIESLCRDVGYTWRDRKLNPGVTVQLFLLQVLHGNTSCNHLRYFSRFRFSSASYCNARKRIPLKVFEKLVSMTVASINQEPDVLWNGHRVWIADGTGCSMPDTTELQEYFGQPTGQGKGCGFPVANLLALMNCKTGLLQKVLVSPLRTHDISRSGELISEMHKGDIAVYDRGFCSLPHISLLKNNGVDSVMRVQSSHRIDFRCSGKLKRNGIRRQRVTKLAKRDQLVQWHKPTTRPSWMSEEQYSQLPEVETLREISYTLNRKAFRSQKIVLVTTLNDHRKYPASKIAELYAMRWEIEDNFRDLKVSMNMDKLKCKTVIGVKKELSVFILVYNLVRQAMLQRARKHSLPTDRISFLDTLRWLIEIEHCRTDTPPIVNPYRPGISVARVVKRRPKAFPRMTSKRKIIKQKQLLIA